MNRRTFLQMITGVAALAGVGGWQLIKSISPRRFVRARSAPWPGRIKTGDEKDIGRMGPWSG